MRRNWARILVIGLLVALPFAVTTIYRAMTELPKEIVIATGTQGGRYRQLMTELARDLEQQTGTRVRFVHTAGSMDNLKLLQDGEVDFALYQPGTLEHLNAGGGPSVDHIRFVANVDTETLHIIVRRGAGFTSADNLHRELVGRNVSLGLKSQGDYATSLILLEHLGLDEAKSIRAQHRNYDGIRKGFANGTLDAAFITVGMNAPILRDMLATGKCRLLDVPNVDALVRHNVSLHVETIPAGLYRSKDGTHPVRPVRTVGVSSQLLTREDVRSVTIQAVMERLFDEKYLRRNELLELFRDGHAFARRKAEFPLHEGAVAIYEPELRPLLNPDFVEATEGIRSFVVSLLIAGFLFYRWWYKRRLMKQEHQLDRYIRALLAIERAQLDLDDGPNQSRPRDPEADYARLQELLDDVTRLRQEALAEFTAHELNEDRATDAFLEMCHALSDKINAKLTRLQLQLGFRNLAETQPQDAASLE